MEKSYKVKPPKIKQSEHILALKLKTEGNSLGTLKTIIVILLIALQAAILALSYLFFAAVFQWYFTFSIILTLITCIYILSSDYHGQAKATWILFLLLSFGFGSVIYFLSDKRISFAKSRKKYTKIFNETKEYKKQNCDTKNLNKDIETHCNYFYTAGNFPTFTNTNTTYFKSGTLLFDSILGDLEKAKDFIFIEYFIISNGKLLSKFLEILKQKAQSGVCVRIIYDDMGSHGTLKRKTKREIKNAGIELEDFNRLVPVFNIALNLRDHRKIVIIDGKISYTGGANLADEYVNEKRMHGYWKDEGIRLEGPATDTFTISFLEQWQFLTKTKIDYSKYINKSKEIECDGVVIPFVSGPAMPFSISQNAYANMISTAKEKLFIMTPYFVPDETITNLLLNKARSGVDVRIILPEIADKWFVYIVSRNNAEKLLESGVKVYTMNSSFVHSKVILNETAAIVGSINVDLRSFNQQFESAVFTSQSKTLEDINKDFDFTFSHSTEITSQNCRRKSGFYRSLAGIFNIISPFM